MTEYSIRKVRDDDKKPVMDIFNYFVENSFAAFPETRLGNEFFDLMRAMAREQAFHVIETGGGKVIGFGILRYYQKAPTFKDASEVTYFILPEHERKGLGKRLMEILTSEARRMGVTTLLAEVSSLNEISLNFHKKNGFRECGRLAGVGRKKGQVFDVVWLQKEVAR